MCEEISSKLMNDLRLCVKDIDTIAQYIKGKGEYGPLISGSMDLDNIDNVYRMSYHMGLTTDTLTPVEISKSISVSKGKLCGKRQARFH